MKKIKRIVIPILILTIILTLFSNRLKNDAIGLEERINKSGSDIKVQEKRRADTIYNLVDCVNKSNSSDTYLKLMDELSDNEKSLATYRSDFNEQIREYNTFTSRKPTKLLLIFSGYKIQSYEYIDYMEYSDSPQNLFYK